MGKGEKVRGGKSVRVKDGNKGWVAKRVKVWGRVGKGVRVKDGKRGKA